MKFHLITLFEEACDAYLNASILGRARKEKKISITYTNPRDFVAPTRSGRGPDQSVGKNKFEYRKVDERPYGGGPGMVMTALPIVRAVEKTLKRGSTKNQAPRTKHQEPNRYYLARSRDWHRGRCW